MRWCVAMGEARPCGVYACPVWLKREANQGKALNPDRFAKTLCSTGAERSSGMSACLPVCVLQLETSLQYINS